MAKYTPGPWIVDGWSEKVSDYAVMYPDPAIKKHDPDEPDDWLLLAEGIDSSDDADLISAAPELYECLLNLVEQGMSNETPHVGRSIFARELAALRKAGYEKEEL